MRVIFLDVDGVLNKNNTKEYFWMMNEKFTGLDMKLVKLLQDYLKTVDARIILSSSWRNFETGKMILQAAGITWYKTTPHRGFKLRGQEIQAILDEGEVTKYVILDDFGHLEFLKHQRRYLIQTSPVHGLIPKNIKKIDEILYGKRNHS